jgi:hypothetical protein
MTHDPIYLLVIAAFMLGVSFGRWTSVEPAIATKAWIFGGAVAAVGFAVKVLT